MCIVFVLSSQKQNHVAKNRRIKNMTRGDLDILVVAEKSSEDLSCVPPGHFL